MLSAASASSLLDMLQSMTSSRSSSANSSGFGQQSSDPFSDIFGGTAMSGKSGPVSGLEGFSQLSPATMSALFAAQSQSSTGSAPSAATGKPDVPKDLFSQLDANGDGQVTKAEFEATAAGAATSSQAFMEQMIARQMQAFASSSSSWMSF